MNLRKDSNGIMTGASDHKLNSHKERIATLVKNKKHSKVRRLLATALAGFIVFTTTYSLVLPAITVGLDTADQVGIVLPEEGLIDETETTENTAYPEDGSLEETGEEAEPAAGASSSYQEPEAANPGDEGLVDGDISADIVGENDGEIISESEEAAAGDLSAGDLNTVLTLTASAENVDLKLTYPQEIPEGSSVAFNPVDSAYYDNYYFSAKDVLEENNTGWEVTEGQFWNVVAAPGIGVEAELDYQELTGVSDVDAGARYVLIDWSDEEWHLYDDEKVAVAFNEEGVLDRINFRTDALYNGAAVFGVLTLEERQETQGEITEDVTTLDGKTKGEPALESNTEGEYTENAQESDIDEAGGTAGTETGSADETAAAEAAQADETAVTDGAQAEETSVSDAAQTEESIGSEAAADEEEQAEETAEDDAKPAEGTDENAQNDSDEQAQTASDSEKADEEDTAVPEEQGKEDESIEDSEDARGTENEEAAETAGSGQEVKDEKESADGQEAKDEKDSVEESADEKDAKDEAEYPAQLFSSEGDVSVYVTAPEGAFPADTKMIVTPVDNEDDIANITDVVADSSIRKIQAVDIAFFDKDGNEIEPKVPIRVRLVADRMESDEDAVVVHVNDNGSAEKVEDASITTSGNQAYITVRTGEEAAISEESNSEKDNTVAETAADGESEISTEADVHEATDPDEATDSNEAIDSDEATDSNKATDSDENVDNGGLTAQDSLEASGESNLQEANLHNTVTADNDQGQNTDQAENILENDNQAGNISEYTNQAGNTLEQANQIDNSLEDINKVGTADQNNADPDLDEEYDSDSLTAEFEAAEFSIYAVVYTVDFHWNVGGKEYAFTLPGGGYVSFEALVEVLGLAGNEEQKTGETEADELVETADDEGLTDNEESGDPEGLYAADVLSLNGIEISEAARAFAAGVETVEFGNPELVWVGKADSKTTVGKLKESEGLDVQYSKELTEEQIEEINAQTVEAGDWALISMLPFDTEETLTVTMKTGEVFIVRVTDAQITKKVLTAKGETYVITVTCSSDSGIPGTADLAVSEITEDSPEEERSYAEYVSDAENVLGAESGSAGYIRLFDIKIVDENDPDIRYQPAPGTSVDVKIELADAESSSLSVVHFADGSNIGEVVENVNAEDEAVCFAAEGFSVYAVVQLGDPAGAMIKSLAELNSAIDADESFMLSVCRQSVNNYFTEGQNDNSCYKVTTSSLEASAWKIQRVESEGENCYIVYSENKGYMKNTEDNKMGYTQNRAEATVFELTGKNNRFYFKVKNENKWLQYSNGGGGIRLYKENTNAENSLIAILDATVQGDPNHLDGNSYGIMLWNGSTTGKAMMAEANTQNPGSLLPKVLTVVTSESNHTDKLYAPGNVADSVTDWTFHWIPENGKYRLSATTADGEKYLRISGTGLELAEESNASEIEVVRGSGSYVNQICLKCDGRTLTYSGNIHDGFGVASGTTTVGNDWLYLVDTSGNNIPENYGRTYVAEKISVSDASLSVEDHINQYGDPKETLEGKYVIIYTRSWNGSGYDYFAVNGEGKLIPCHENGNVIEWVGSSQDDMLWKFIEYKDASGNVTHYYDLYNEATGNWLAPQLTPEHHLTDAPVGLNMSGRRYGEYYSPILAWDHSSYTYSSLKVDRTANNNADDESIVSCRRTDPDSADFYFALVQELNVDDQLHGVPTVNNDLYGIKMQMVDLDNKAGDSGYMNAFLGNSEGGIGLTLHQGLLSTKLEENGYPDVVIKPENNLGSLFSRNGAAPANHLFIESTYRETGYYVYDSTQNFATFNKGTGDFTVYDQLGTHDAASRNTLKHGQFFPYNDLKPGVFSEKNRENLYNIDGITLLGDDDPRKYEQLYLIEDPDYYFGMELEASFEQTPSGLDAWGHDIIFEFSGDDDFWLYVDGELVIDLGGIHSAVSGSVNFRTGGVIVNGQPTTLYDLFLDHYMNRDGMTEADARNLLLNGRAADPENNIKAVPPVFTEKDGKYIFTDYSSHTMRIFYFERGASASNLHMKFNLAAAKKGTVQLSKKVENVASASELLFPYQIYYRFASDTAGQYTRLTNSTEAFRRNTDYYEQTYGYEVDRPRYTKDYVFHQGSDTPIDFDPCLKIGSHLYEDVFFLSPDKSAEINFPTKGDGDSPERIADYYIVECGIDTNEYKTVTVNEEVVTGTAVPDQEGIRDFATTAASPEQRSSVRYVNEAEIPGSLKFTKIIYDPEGNKIDLADYYEGHPEGMYYESGPTFDFRLYFGSPFDTGANTAAYMYVYRVKDPDGKYCHWNSDKERFEIITGPGYEKGTTNFEDLSEDRVEGNTTIYGDKTLASFDSSTFGSITRIPPYYTVEVHDLVPGLWYKVIERPTETPDGYRLYKCEKDGTEIREAQWATGIYEDDKTWKGVDGRIETNKESVVKIGNKEGYGLRINKTWTDAKTITDREPTYFAVYKAVTGEGGGTALELVENSVRQMAYSANPDWQTLVWYYDFLPDGGTLGDYWVYESALTAADGQEISVAENGVVSGYETCTPVGISVRDAKDSRPLVARDGLTLYGTPAGAEERQAIYYKATYGESTPYPLGGSKVRNFTVTNEPKNRPVIRLKKENWNDEPLAGAAFNLVEEESGARIGGNLVSDNNGLFDPELIYLDYDKSYILTETRSPDGYIGLPQSLIITMPAEPVQGQSEGLVTVSPAEEEIQAYYKLTQKTENDPPTLTIKDRPYELKVLKADTTTGAEIVPLAGAEFKLYKYRTINNSTEPVPVNGFEKVTTDENGYILNLPTEPGNYALEEITPPSGYSPLAEHDWISFTISPIGVIGQPTSEAGATLAGPTAVKDDTEGRVEYIITIPNTPLPLYLKKVDAAGNELTGAKFSLSRRVAAENPEPEVPAGQSAPGNPSSHQPWQIVNEYSEIDMTSIGQTELSRLPRGLYCLTETLAPKGYVIFESKTYFRITDDRKVELTNEDGTGANSNSGARIETVKDEKGNTVYVITVINSPGITLPATGGIGTTLYTVSGICLIALAVFLLLRKRSL